MMNRLTGFGMINIFILVLIYGLNNIQITNHKVSNGQSAEVNKSSALTDKFQPTDQQNQAPVVKINSPGKGGQYEWNTNAPFSISVADKEDGDSKFEEILPNEVFLEVRYIKDSSKIKAALSLPAKKDPQGLTVIKTSNCLNCHAFRSLLIGPSFYDISKRYPATPANIDLLSKHILEGSSGVWGKVVMPTHPELTALQTKETVKWILANATKTDMNYFTGTEGSFRIQPPVSAKDKGFLLLTASYTDHGLKDNPNAALKGQDKVVLKIR